MAAGVNMPGNDVQGRNLQILGTALSLARDVFKVRMDDKALDAANKLSGEKETRVAAEKKAADEVAFNKEFVLAPEAPNAFQLPGREGRYITRAEAQQKEKMAFDASQKERDRRTDIEKASMLAQTKADAKQPTEGERLTALYGKRLEQANNQLNNIEGAATSAGSYLESWLPSALQSKERQLLEQSQRNFITAALRKESGASISPTEFDTAKSQYFAQPGDSPEVVAQKKANRELVIQGFQVAAGKGYDNLTAQMGKSGSAPAADKKMEIPGVGVVSREDILKELQRRQGQTGTASK